VTDFLQSEECEQLIECSEKNGYVNSVPTGGGHGRTGREEPRKNKFTVIEDKSYADALFNKIKQFLPPTLEWISSSPYFGEKGGSEWIPIGCVERLRFYKYEKGDIYPEHMDGAYKRKVLRNNQRYQQQSFLTLLLYLNEGFEGGETIFFPDHQHCRFLRDIENKVPTISQIPKKGTALVNIHNVLHAGSEVISGIKYVLRTDIIFERKVIMNPKIAKYANIKYDLNEISPWEKIFEPSCKLYND